MNAPRLDPAHPLAVALAAGRDRYNAQFEAARARLDGLDGADVLVVLAETVAPLADAPEADASALLDALYPLVLDATGRAWIGPGARQPEVGAAWTDALVRCRRHVERDPARMSSALLHALRTLAATPGAQPLRWSARLGALADQAETVDALLDAGAILAWREGLVRLREAAIRVASRLPPRLALLALGVEPDPARLGALPEALPRLRTDPWCTPEAAFEPSRADATPEIRAVCGGFRGFGGPFLRPPTLAASTAGIVASDGDRWFRLHADVFGTAFERIADFEAMDMPGSPSIRSDGRVDWGARRVRLDALAGSPSTAATATTLAVVLPTSHRIALIA